MNSVYSKILAIKKTGKACKHQKFLINKLIGFPTYLKCMKDYLKNVEPYPKQVITT